MGYYTEFDPWPAKGQYYSLWIIGTVTGIFVMGLLGIFFYSS